MQNKELLAKLAELLRLQHERDQLRDNEIMPLLVKIQADRIEEDVARSHECPADASEAERRRKRREAELKRLTSTELRPLEDQIHQIIEDLLAAAR